jgi:hypothetical protein
VTLGHAVTPSVERASGRERVPLDVVAVPRGVPGPIADVWVHTFLFFSFLFLFSCEISSRRQPIWKDVSLDGKGAAIMWHQTILRQDRVYTQLVVKITAEGCELVE